MTAPPSEARAMCARCRRPEVVCYCAHLPQLPTRTRVLVLQHPRERRMAIGTAHMAHLSLPSSRLRVGVSFAGDPVVTAALGDGPSYLLFPGADALDLGQLPVDRPVTLVVLDGTWSQARKLLRMNPQLAALPRVAFARERPSEYRIRRQPADFCVSTIEALAEVLGVLEPEGGPFEQLLAPFRAMVDRQIWFKTEVRSDRHRRAQPGGSARAKKPTLAMRLSADWPRLVCMQGEANAWPVDDPTRLPPETAHFVACRPASGACYEAIVAPLERLAPSTALHLDLPAARLQAGVSRAEWQRSWDAFCQPDDVLVQWGSFHAELARSEGLPLPARRLDLRVELVRALHQRVGTVEECLQRLGASPLPLALDGRGGRRLAALVGLVEALRTRG